MKGTFHKHFFYCKTLKYKPNNQRDIHCWNSKFFALRFEKGWKSISRENLKILSIAKIQIDNRYLFLLGISAQPFFSPKLREYLPLIAFKKYSNQSSSLQAMEVNEYMVDVSPHHYQLMDQPWNDSQYPLSFGISPLKRKNCSDSSNDVCEVVRRIKKFKFPVYITIKTLTGRTIDLDIDSNLTIAHLKELLALREGIPQQQQRLVFDGKQINDENFSLQSFGIIDGSVIYLVLALPNTKGYSGVSSQHRVNS